MKLNPHVKDALEDLANEIFVRITQELAAPVSDNPEGLLCETLREVEKEWRSCSVAGPIQDHSSAADQLQPRIETALATLSPDQRDALFLHLGRGMPCGEIARQTGVPRIAVLNDLVRAYSRLRMLLTDLDLQNVYPR